MYNWVGEILILIFCFNHFKTGEAVLGSAGELVCTKPFPSMPVSFWNDQDGSRYHKSYFNKFPGLFKFVLSKKKKLNTTPISCVESWLENQSLSF